MFHNLFQSPSRRCLRMATWSALSSRIVHCDWDLRRIYQFLANGSPAMGKWATPSTSLFPPTTPFSQQLTITLFIFGTSQERNLRGCTSQEPLTHNLFAFPVISVHACVLTWGSEHVCLDYCWRNSTSSSYKFSNHGFGFGFVTAAKY